VSIYRNPGAFWDGKLEMVNAPLPHISEDCLLWQIDADELWTAEQISTVRTLFLAHPNKTAAYYFCRYFVTPEDLITTHDTYGNYTSYEWLRTWRFTPGSRWFSHEPPRLCRRSAGDTWQDIACIDPFMHNDTDAFGLRFQHFAYATPNQLVFKAIYYGYSGAMASWHLLRQTMEFPVPLKNYFPWVKGDALVDRALTHGVKPLAWQEPDGTWRFGPVDDPSLNKNRKILYVRTDSIGDAILASSMLFYIRDAYQNAHISVLCQEHIAELYEACPYIDEIITFNLKKAETDFTYRDQIVESIRERHFDLALNPVYSRNGLGDHFVMASEIVERIGHQGDLSNLTEKQRETNNANYSKLLPSEGAWRTELERHRDFLAGLDIRVAELNPSVWITPDDFSFAEEFFHANQLDPKRTVALFSGAQHSSRHYLGYGQALSELCIQRGFTVIALGGPEDADLNRNNLADLSVKTIDLSGKTTLRQTAALLSRCCLAIGAETGLAHMACAVDVPNVILLGGGHAGRFIPYSRLTTAVSLPLACFGCNWHCKYVTTYCVRSIDPVSLGKACHVVLDTPTDRARVIVQTAATGTIPDDFPMYTDISRFIDPSLADIITLTGDSSMQNTVTNTTDQLQSVKINNRLQEGEEYFSRGDFDSAIDCFNRIVHRYPECSAPAHSNLGVIYWQHGETQISLEHLSSAIKLDPSYRPAVTNSIAVLEQLGAFSAATGICRDFLELHPDDLELQHKMQDLGDSGFHQLEENWERFAQADPMWAILTDPAKKGNKWEPGEFFATGIKDIQGLFNYLKGIDISPSLDSALDFGCGVGRITQALAMRFATATGIDIAPSMIREAKRNNRFDVNCRYMLNQRNDLEMFADGTFDFIYSVITLQHIRPLYIRNYLVEFMRVLKPNGILVFQLPSRLYGVPTPLQEIDYAIEPTSKEPRMEMHGIPKEELIEFIEEHGGKAVDIIPDRSLEPAWESYRYCVIKYGS
ncbi:MAG TPA: methyltransferase domain-containing protein, partial [Geobacteraceae bacterium]|nr:methyltransferase domain-containing protein [Geobacteraceae bacterium]